MEWVLLIVVIGMLWGLLYIVAHSPSVPDKKKRNKQVKTIIKKRSLGSKRGQAQ